MSNQQKAKVFQNGRSQAVRLPVNFRFHTDEVYIRRDEVTGDVILSTRPNSSQFWEEFFSRPAPPEAEDLLAERGLGAPSKRKLL